MRTLRRILRMVRHHLHEAVGSKGESHGVLRTIQGITRPQVFRPRDTDLTRPPKSRRRDDDPRLR